MRGEGIDEGREFFIERHHLFGIVCADRVGDRAEIVGCGRGELLGFYESPAKPKRTCKPGDAYSRRPGFTVCWLDLFDRDSGLERLRLPGVRRWELA